MADTFLVIETGPPTNIVLSGVGASAYQIWLNEGNAGTEQDFLDSLEGPQGPTGATGATGPQGDPGFVSLNGLTNPTQTFAAGTAGADFAISSSGTAHTFNLPSSSASNRGLLLAADWSAFNSKIGGSGAAGQIAHFIVGGTLSGSDNLFLNTTSYRLGVGTKSPEARIHAYDGSAGSVTAISSSVLVLENSSHAYINILTPSGSAAGIIVGQGTNNNFTGLTYNRNVAGAWDISTAVAGENSAFWLRNSNNSNTSSRASINMLVGGASAGDAYSTYTISGVVSWSAGVDNSDSDKFKIGYGGEPGTFDVIIITTSGKVGIGATSPSAKLSITGATGYSQFNMSQTYTPTGSADPLGSNGDLAYDANYIYIKVGGSWKRSALSTF